jgi:hypothetical protein
MSGAARPGPARGTACGALRRRRGRIARSFTTAREPDAPVSVADEKQPANVAFSSPYSVTTTRSSPEAWILVAYPASAVISRTYVMSESNRSSPPTRGTGCPAGLM